MGGITGSWWISSMRWCTSLMRRRGRITIWIIFGGLVDDGFDFGGGAAAFGICGGGFFAGGAALDGAAGGFQVFTDAVTAGVFVDGGELAVVAARLGGAADAEAEDQIGNLVAHAG